MSMADIMPAIKQGYGRGGRIPKTGAVCEFCDELAYRVGNVRALTPGWDMCRKHYEEMMAVPITTKSPYVVKRGRLVDIEEQEDPVERLKVLG